LPSSYEEIAEQIGLRID
jgi:hypothetical protein